MLLLLATERFRFDFLIVFLIAFYAHALRSPMKNFEFWWWLTFVGSWMTMMITTHFCSPSISDYVTWEHLHQLTVIMRWLRRSSEPPQLLGLSPLRTEDSLSISTVSINSIDHNQNKIQSETVSDVFRNRTPNHSTRKSRIGEKIIWCFLIFILSSPSSGYVNFGKSLSRFNESNQNLNSHQKSTSLNWTARRISNEICLKREI